MTNAEAALKKPGPITHTGVPVELCPLIGIPPRKTSSFLSHFQVREGRKEKRGTDRESVDERERERERERGG